MCRRAVQFRKVVYITATLMINSAQDLYGYLKIMWRSDWPLAGMRTFIERPMFPFRKYYTAKAVNPRSFTDPLNQQVRRMVNDRVYNRKPA
jgi:hypothetical protein